jgi:hypothetical protein
LEFLLRIWSGRCRSDNKKEAEKDAWAAKMKKQVEKENKKNKK